MKKSDTAYLIPLFLLAGFLYTIATKLQTAQAVVEAGIHKHFFHPYLQCLLFFIGETCCLPIYYRFLK